MRVYRHMPVSINSYGRISLPLAINPHGGKPVWRLITNQLTTSKRVCVTDVRVVYAADGAQGDDSDDETQYKAQTERRQNAACKAVRLLSDGWT